jgi:hypothetical protein
MQPVPPYDAPGPETGSARTFRKLFAAFVKEELAERTGRLGPAYVDPPAEHVLLQDELRALAGGGVDEVFAALAEDDTLTLGDAACRTLRDGLNGRLTGKQLAALLAAAFLVRHSDDVREARRAFAAAAGDDERLRAWASVDRLPMRFDEGGARRPTPLQSALWDLLEKGADDADDADDVVAVATALLNRQSFPGIKSRTLDATVHACVTSVRELGGLLGEIRASPARGQDAGAEEC